MIDFHSELMQAIPQRAIDLQVIDCIQGYKSNLHNAGRLLRQVLRAKLSFLFGFWFLVFVFSFWLTCFWSIAPINQSINCKHDFNWFCPFFFTNRTGSKLPMQTNEPKIDIVSCSNKSCWSPINKIWATTKKFTWLKINSRWAFHNCIETTVSN